MNRTYYISYSSILPNRWQPQQNTTHYCPQNPTKDVKPNIYLMLLLIKSTPQPITKYMYQVPLPGHHYYQTRTYNNKVDHRTSTSNYTIDKSRG
jgi:hypothetical protein